MSNKTQLQANNTQLAAMIETLQGKAAGGGGSGGAVETCTLKVKVTGYRTEYEQYGSIGVVLATVATDTGIDICAFRNGNNDSTIKEITVPNVLCNSYVSFHGNTYGYGMYATEYCDGAEVVDGWYESNYRITAEPGGEAIIYYEIDEE